MEKNVKIEPFESTIGNEIIICFDQLPFGVLSLYHYLNIETKNITSFYAGEDESFFEMDGDGKNSRFNK